MNNNENNVNNFNQPNVQPNLGNSVSYDNQSQFNQHSMPTINTVPNPISEPMVEPVQPTPGVEPDNSNSVESAVKSNTSKNSSGKLILVIVVIIILVIATVGFFIGKSMIDSEISTNTSVTDKTNKNTEPEIKTVTYNGVNLVIPNGYIGELSDDYGVVFNTSDRAYSIDFFEGTISDLDSALLEMGAVSKGNKEINDIPFSLYSYTKSGKTELIYVTDTSTFRIMGFAVNNSYNYKEEIVKDVIASLGGTTESMANFSPAEAVNNKVNSKALKTIYNFEK